MADITYWDAVGAAWERMKTILFRPFQMEKWFVIGFGAWIAGLNIGGGASSGGGTQSTTNRSGEPFSGNGFSQFSEFWSSYGGAIITAGLIIIPIVLVLTIVWSWVNARGRFVFYDNLIYNRGAIAEPWKKYRKQGNSLFLWNLVIGAIGLLVFVAALLIGLPFLIALFTEQATFAQSISVIMIDAFLIGVYSLIIAYIQLIVNDFIVPLMLKHNLRIREGWAYFSTFAKPAIGSFLLYGLVIFLINTIISFAVAAAGIATCCMLFLLLVIPYIGTVALLPVLIFRRWIGIEFLRQFGEDIDSIATDADDGEEPRLTIPEPDEPTR